MAHPHSAWVGRCGVAPWMLCGIIASAWGAANNADLPPSSGTPGIVSSPHATGASHDFDIPAQSLEDALDLYARVSRRPALFASDMVTGRTSSAVRGRYSSEAALRLLLDGTGLVAEKLDSDRGETFLLKEGAAQAPTARSSMADLFTADDYPGLIQARVWDALCADARTAPGRYSYLLHFQLDAAGRVYGAGLLGTTGDARRDAAILQTVQHVQISQPPPAAWVRQRLTLLIRASDPRADAGPGLQCAGHDRKAAH